MGLLKVEGVTHWSIPVNNLEESEKFYGDLLGLKPLGRLGNAVMSCFNVGDHNILLCEREQTVSTSEVEQRVHHSFTVSPETFVQACKVFHEKQIPSSSFIRLAPVVEMIGQPRLRPIGIEPALRASQPAPGQ
jgi:catechol 2,3-dioxygenase-like lactoylglutathione lyase family enzyme